MSPQGADGQKPLLAALLPESLGLVGKWGSAGASEAGSQIPSGLYSLRGPRWSHPTPSCKTSQSKHSPVHKREQGYDSGRQQQAGGQCDPFLSDRPQDSGREPLCWGEYVTGAYPPKKKKLNSSLGPPREKERGKGG